MKAGDRPLTALVLAGGLARRLGGHKADRSVGGRSLLDAALALAAAVADEVILLPGDRLDVEGGPGVRCVPDAPGLQGPLAGLLGGLAAARHPECLLLSCDMPLLTPADLEPLLRARAAEGAACVPWSDGRRQPFPGLYARSILGPARRYAAAGGRSLRGLLDGVPTRRVDPADDERWRIVGADVDTLDDLHRAREACLR